MDDSFLIIMSGVAKYTPLIRVVQGGPIVDAIIRKPIVKSSRERLEWRLLYIAASLSTGQFPSVIASLSQYLLDRINIHDTITRLSAYSDCRDFERLGNEVFASSAVTVDSSLVTNEESCSRPGKEEAEFWAKYLERFTAAQHVLTCILVNLPQPALTWNIATPNKATASANALVTMRRDRARGETIAQHGSYYTFDLIRQTGADPGSNPWRISHMKAHPFWFRGNMEVMS